VITELRFSAWRAAPGRMAAATRPRRIVASSTTSTALLALIFVSERRRFKDEEARSRLVDAQSPCIVEALWDYDSELLQALTEGLRNYPYIGYVRIEDMVDSSARHLTATAPVPLELEKERRGDEFDRLADALNAMSAKLYLPGHGGRA
jgi:hypothetical protein